MNTSELRQRFLDYFAANGHRVVSSSPVIGPADDPTVMWTNAGMVQFKDLFLGKEEAIETAFGFEQPAFSMAAEPSHTRDAYAPPSPAPTSLFDPDDLG